MPPKTPRPALSDLPAGSLVYIVDDDEPIRKSLNRLFASARIPSQTYGAAQAFLDREKHDGPSCVILDVRMPGLDGLALQEALLHSDSPVIFLTGFGDVPMCAKAMKSGAIDFLGKPVDDTELLTAVGRALERSVEVRKTRATRVSARAKLNDLTPREFAVMQRVIAGLRNKEIADVLGIAEKTTKIHRGRVMEKMGVDSVADLVRLAQEAGVSPASDYSLPA